MDNTGYKPLIIGVEHELPYLDRTKSLIEDLEGRTIMIEAGRDWRKYDGEFFTEIGKFAVEKGFEVIAGDVSKRQLLVMLKNCLRDFLEKNYSGEVENYKKKYAGQKSRKLQKIIKDAPEAITLSSAVLTGAVCLAAPLRDKLLLEKALKKKPDSIIVGAVHADFLKENLHPKGYTLIVPEHINVAQSTRVGGETLIKFLYDDKRARNIMMFMGCIDFKASVDLLRLKTYGFRGI